jgi:hypothetical protein
MPQTNLQQPIDEKTAEALKLDPCGVNSSAPLFDEDIILKEFKGIMERGRAKWAFTLANAKTVRKVSNKKNRRKQTLKIKEAKERLADFSDPEMLQLAWEEYMKGRREVFLTYMNERTLKARKNSGSQTRYTDEDGKVHCSTFQHNNPEQDVDIKHGPGSSDSPSDGDKDGPIGIGEISEALPLQDKEEEEFQAINSFADDLTKKRSKEWIARNVYDPNVPECKLGGPAVVDITTDGYGPNVWSDYPEIREDSQLPGTPPSSPDQGSVQAVQESVRKCSLV